MRAIVTLLMVLSALLVTVPSQAAVLAVNEWEDLTRPCWTYGNSQAGVPVVIDAAPTGGSSPSGGGALKFTYPAGTFPSSTSGGQAAYDLTCLAASGLTDIWIGHFEKRSAGFVFNANGTKMDFLILRDVGAGTLGRGNLSTGWLYGTSNPLSVSTNQITWTPQTKNYNSSYTYSAPTTWKWIEEHYIINTPGVQDGVHELYIDDVRYANQTNIAYRDATNNAGWGQFNFAGTWGGGGGTIPAVQYWWVDHSTIATTRQGRPGGAQPQDTTPPPAPVLTTNVSDTTVTATWPAVIDGGSPASGVASYTLRRCTGTSCSPTSTLTTVGAQLLTYVDSGLANSTVYGYCLLATDAAGNSSACSTPTQYETTGSPPPPPTPPTITNLSGTPSSLTVTHGAVTATSIRIQLGDNAGNFESNTVYPIASFPSGILSLTIPAGTQFTCAYPRDADGIENTAAGAYRCIGQIAGVPPVDTDAIVMGTTFPATILPAGTTSALYGVPIDKSGNCRADSVNRAYVSMDTGTTAVQMNVLNLTASLTLGSLTNGSSATRYIRCEFVNTFGASYYTTASAVATIAVDTSTADTTPPGTVSNVVATAQANTTNVVLTWDAATGGDVAFYRTYLSIGACSTYSLTGLPVATTSTLLSLAPLTAYCFKVEAVDTSGNPSAALSTAATVTTSFVPDVEPPSNVTGFRIADNSFSGSVVLAWDAGTDNQGPAFTEISVCQGAACTNFVAQSVRVSTTSLVLSLLPGTSYRAIAIHYDQAGNPSGGIASPTYSDIIEFTTTSVGLSRPRPDLRFGTTRPTPSAPKPATNRPARP